MVHVRVTQGRHQHRVSGVDLVWGIDPKVNVMHHRGMANMRLTAGLASPSRLCVMVRASHSLKRFMTEGGSRGMKQLTQVVTEIAYLWCGPSVGNGVHSF